jgi:hypothetical protein
MRAQTYVLSSATLCVLSLHGASTGAHGYKARYVTVNLPITLIFFPPSRRTPYFLVFYLFICYVCKRGRCEIWGYTPKVIMAAQTFPRLVACVCVRLRCCKGYRHQLPRQGSQGCVLCKPCLWPPSQHRHEGRHLADMYQRHGVIPHSRRHSIPLLLNCITHQHQTYTSDNMC